MNNRYFCVVMKWVRKHFIKSVSLALALHFFNISINTPNLNAEWMPEDLSINKMESITEIIFEEVLHCDNLFVEHQESGGLTRGTLVITHYDLFQTQHFFSFHYLPELPHHFYLKQVQDLFQQFLPEVITPPPKA